MDQYTGAVPCSLRPGTRTTAQEPCPQALELSSAARLNRSCLRCCALLCHVLRKRAVCRVCVVSIFGKPSSRGARQLLFRSHHLALHRPAAADMNGLASLHSVETRLHAHDAVSRAEGRPLEPMC